MIKPILTEFIFNVNFFIFIDIGICDTYNVLRIIQRGSMHMALEYDRNGKPIRPVHPKEPEGFLRVVPYNLIVLTVVQG